MWYYLPSITLCFTFSGRDDLLNCASCSDEGLCCSLLSDWVAQTLSSSDRDTSASSSPDNPTHGPSKNSSKNKNGRPDEWLHPRPWNSVAHWLQRWPWLLYHLSERSSSTQPGLAGQSHSGCRIHCMQVQQPGITPQKHSSPVYPFLCSWWWYEVIPA